MYPVILAGGLGTRLWPLSKKNKPKQVHAIVGDDTLLQATWDRLRKQYKADDIYIATGIDQASVVKKQLPLLVNNNLLLEPTKQDTAAAIGLAALRLRKRNKQAIITTVNSDAYIVDTNKYLNYLQLAEEVVKKYSDRIIMLGINPVYPETGYGYIKLGNELEKFKKQRIFEIDRFVEKPNLAKAKIFLQKWDYLWNPAMFVFRADTLLDLYKKYLPQHYSLLMKIDKYLGSKDEANQLAKLYKKIPKVSIDYGLLEKLNNMIVIPADFEWSDIGHWRSVKQLISDKVNNIKGDKVVVHNCKNNLIYNYNDKLIAAIGLENMILMQTEDAILVCPANHAQDVKKIIEEIKKKGYEEYL